MNGLSGRNYEPKHNLARSARSLMSRSSEYSYEPSGPGPWLGLFEISRSPLGPLGSMPTLLATVLHRKDFECYVVTSGEWRLRSCKIQFDTIRYINLIFLN